MSFDDWSAVILDTGASMLVNFDINKCLGPVRATGLKVLEDILVNYYVKGEEKFQWKDRYEYGGIGSIRNTTYYASVARII